METAAVPLEKQRDKKEKNLCTSFLSDTFPDDEMGRLVKILSLSIVTHANWSVRECVVSSGGAERRQMPSGAGTAGR